jgi:hypothetical protein
MGCLWCRHRITVVFLLRKSRQKVMVLIQACMYLLLAVFLDQLRVPVGGHGKKWRDTMFFCSQEASRPKGSGLVDELIAALSPPSSIHDSNRQRGEVPVCWRRVKSPPWPGVEFLRL